jgi:stearoyl-CoA desaturase (delta-9 desaturase)
VIDGETLQAVIAHRYDVLAKYAKSLKATYAQELDKLSHVPGDAEALKGLRRWLHHDEAKLAASHRAQLEAGLAKSKALHTAYSMRRELAEIWERSAASKDQLVKKLQDWCHRAETSGIAPLVEFSQTLRCYA